MANNYFRFKQFTIHQDHCAMKVTTDGCLFGAWVASMGERFQTGNINNVVKALDIGAGTGLLSLMYAQKNNVWIDAVELDAEAAQQALTNVKDSPWSNRIHVIHQDIKNLTDETKFQVIISNPPFYEQQLKGDNKGRNTAHHSSHLTLMELFQAVDKLLDSEGVFYVLLPFYRIAEAIKVANVMGFSIQEKVLVKQSLRHEDFRGMLAFGKEEFVYEQKSLSIETERGVYSNDFIDLLKDYYLKL